MRAAGGVRGGPYPALHQLQRPGRRGQGHPHRQVHRGLLRSGGPRHQRPGEGGRRRHRRPPLLRAGADRRPDPVRRGGGGGHRGVPAVHHPHQPQDLPGAAQEQDGHRHRTAGCGGPGGRLRRGGLGAQRPARPKAKIPVHPVRGGPEASPRPRGGPGQAGAFGGHSPARRQDEAQGGASPPEKEQGALRRGLLRAGGGGAQEAVGRRGRPLLLPLGRPPGPEAQDRGPRLRGQIGRAHV